MEASVPFVLLFGVVLGLLVKFKVVGYLPTFVAVMFGFFLAATGASDPIMEVIDAILEAVSSN